MYAPEQAVIATPLGLIRVEGRDTLERVTIGIAPAPLQPGSGIAADGARQIAEFIAGRRRAFELPLATAGTARGAALRAAIVAIGYGATLSYGAVAALAGSSPRAIGQACARNPLPLVVPCHRVLAAGGPGHYSAGEGLPTKAWLLDLERAQEKIA